MIWWRRKPDGQKTREAILLNLIFMAKNFYCYTIICLKALYKETNRGLEWYQSKAYDSSIAARYFFYLKGLVPLNLKKHFSAS
jgi:hypothetical protein